MTFLCILAIIFFVCLLSMDLKKPPKKGLDISHLLRENKKWRK